MKILVINCGSSSLKYQLIDTDTAEALCKGLCERIGIGGGSVSQKSNGITWELKVNMNNHADAFAQMVHLITKGGSAVISDKSEIDAVGHRVVHGGEAFTQSTLITNAVIDKLEELSPLAPLHNPAQVIGIRSSIRFFGIKMPQVAVFDTAFHQTMPPKAYVYPIPYEYYREHGIRRYGFHGTSHRFVAEQAAIFLDKPLQNLKIITCHLGNGSSISAIDSGKSVDTSMGFTPLGGLIMGTRSGDLDPSVVTYMASVTGKSLDEINDVLNKESGFLGVSGISSDNRDIATAAESGHKRALLVQDIFSYQIKKFIGGYAAAMGGVDCVVFTGGIGENSSRTRAAVCEDLGFMGIHLDPDANEIRGQMVDISLPQDTVRVLVVPTNEELMIAKDTLQIVRGK